MFEDGEGRMLCQFRSDHLCSGVFYVDRMWRIGCVSVRSCDPYPSLKLKSTMLTALQRAEDMATQEPPPQLPALLPHSNLALHVMHDGGERGLA